jgi:hypothetical protein
VRQKGVDENAAPPAAPGRRAIDDQDVTRPAVEGGGEHDAPLGIEVTVERQGGAL